TLGKIVGAFGIKGWVRVSSHTATVSNILDYNPWLLQIAGEWLPYKVVTGQLQGKILVAQLGGVEDRTTAEKLVGCPIAVAREQLRPLPAGEYYWADLVGMEVVTSAGVCLGKVDYLFETGANDVMVVQGERERLVPWILQSVIQSVSLTERRIVVDWDPDF
ncbi:MAG: ribosome maturation factor RimM, partial [Thiothrix sp.]